jgi:hypothetical protein
VNVDDPVAPVTDCLIPVYDSSGDQAALGYGEPNDPHATPMPGGPLQFTVTGS